MALRVLALLALVASVSAQSGIETGFSDPGLTSTSGYATTLELPLNYYAAKPIEQVMVSQSDNLGTAYWIIWHTNLTTPSFVWLGTDGTTYPLKYSGSAARYTYGTDYVSALIHKVNCTGLSYGTQYFFRIGKNPVYYGNFTTMPAPNTYPMKIAAIADLGTTNNSLLTLTNIVANGAQAVFMAGDLSYADGYQPRWDLFGRMMADKVGNLPFYFCYGNHEQEQFVSAYKQSTKVFGMQQISGFYPSDSRFASSAQAWMDSYFPGGTPGNALSSANVGPLHLLNLNTYYAYGKYTVQWSITQTDLARVDRTQTPFVAVMLHAPWYNTYFYHYLEGETMRTIIEPFLRQYLVDIVITGHVHGYERFKNVYQYKEDPCGPIHVTLGDAGNREGCTATNYGYINAPYQPADFQLWGGANDANGSPPSISAFREYSYGHAIINIVNSSWAQFTWYRNQNFNNGTFSASDSTWFPSHTGATYGTAACKPASSSISGRAVFGANATNAANYPQYPNYPNNTHPYYSLPPVDFDSNGKNSWYPLR